MIKEIFLPKALFEALGKEAAKQEYTVDQYVMKICLENLPKEKQEHVKALMEEKGDYVEVTLKVPKPVVDLFKAAVIFTKGNVTLEELCVQRMMWGLHTGMEELDNGLMQTFDMELNKKAYGLDKISDC